MRRWYVILLVVVCGAFGPAALDASALKTQLKVHEACVFKLLPDNGIVLTTKLTLKNASGGRTVTVRYRAGWNVEQYYPKAPTELVVRLGPGKSASRSITRRLVNAPVLWQTLRDADDLNCASTKVYTIS